MDKILLIEWEEGKLTTLADESSIEQETLEFAEQGTHSLVMAEQDVKGKVQYFLAYVEGSLENEEDEESEMRYEIIKWKPIA